jgi:hypothetical protein
MNGERAIEPESALELLSRRVDPGDLVKRTIASSEVALVLSTNIEIQAEDALTCDIIDAWIPMDKLTSVTRFREGDKVVSGGWVGAITMVAQVGLAMNASGRTYEMYDTWGFMEVGFKVVVSGSDLSSVHADALS